MVSRIWAAAAVLVAIGCASTPAQDDAAAYLPLGENAQWTWRFTNRSSGVAYETSARALRPMEAADARCWELRRRSGTSASWSYEGTRADGVYVWRNEYLGGLRGMDRREAPRRILAFPVAAGTTWSWTEQGTEQLMEGADPSPPERLRMEYSGRIEAVDEVVVVPAGTWKAVRARITMKGGWGGTTDETTWWAKGVGIVKRVESGGEDGPYVHELVAFTPPSQEAPVNDDEVLARHLGEPPRCADDNAVTERAWVSHAALKDAFRSRFARVACHRGQHLVRVHRGKAVRFDPRLIDDWNALVADEGLVGDGAGIDESLITHLAAACGVLVGTLEHPVAQCRRSGGTSSTCELRGDERSWSGEAATLFTTADGKSSKVSVRVEARNDKLTAVTAKFE